MKKASKEEVEIIKKEFLLNYDKAKTELIYFNEYQLLIDIILSAQCTDKRVNLITPALFEKYPDIKALSNADLEKVKDILKTCSFYNNKSKNIIKMAQKVLNDFNGEIPKNHKDLISLAGVGNKTANVFLIETQGANLMAVDTHVFRVSHRLGLSCGKNVKETEEQLVKILEKDLNIFHQAMVLYGRYICKAINPECDKCLFPFICKSKKNFRVK